MRRLLLVAALLLFAHAAAAHPLSRDKWSLRTAIQLAGDKLDAVVVLEVPFDVVTSELRSSLEAARSSPDASRAAQAVLEGYTRSQWDRMARGLSLTVNGERVPGAWKPRQNRLNGKGAVSGGFFMYIVEFVPEGPLPLGGDVRLVVDNQGYTEAPMVYSAMVVSGSDWKVAENSAAALLPDRPYDLNAPDFWIEDPALRKVAARFTRAP